MKNSQKFQTSLSSFRAAVTWKAVLKFLTLFSKNNLWSLWLALIILAQQSNIFKLESCMQLKSHKHVKNIFNIKWHSGVDGGSNERRLLGDLLQFYNNLERPVFNESEAVELQLGLTLQQIIDVVNTLKHSLFVTKFQCSKLSNFLRNIYFELLVFIFGGNISSAV